jgi:hypothetical protein
MDDAGVCRAIEDIKNLKSRYFQCMDFKRWDEYPALFTDDMIVYDEDGSVRSTGGADFARSVGGFLADARTLHQAYMPEIEIVDADNARGVWAMHDILTWENGDPQGGMKRIEGWGHYHETYRREGDGWRIASMKLTRLHVEASK